MPVHIIVKDTRTMDMTIDQQVALDEALVPHARKLRIGKSNFRLRPDITSKESTLQLVYDVLRLTPFYKAFLVTADATATVHHHSIRFKMDNKKHIINLESFREIFHIFPRLPNQSFVEPPFEEEILAFLHFLGHSAVIRKLTNANINKLHQPWRAFASIINNCLTEKSSGYDSLRNSNAYKEYYAVATGATPPKPKASVRKTRSSSDITITPPTATGPRLTTSEKGKQATKASKAKSLSALDICYDSLRLSLAQILWGMCHKKNVDFAYLLWEDFVYQVEHKDAKKRNEMYYPRKTKSSSNTTITPPTTVGTRLSTFAKGKQPAKASKSKSLTMLSEVAMTEAEQIKLATKKSMQQTHISQASGSVQMKELEWLEEEELVQSILMLTSLYNSSAPKEKAIKTTGKSTQGSKSQQKTVSESAPAEKPMQTTQYLEEPSHQEFETGAANDQPIAEASQHPE
nr:hypothetical protein [Tanacetum cinerariifolium]